MVSRVLQRLDQPTGGYYGAQEALSAINEGIRFFTLLTLGLEGSYVFSPTVDTTFYHMQPLVPDWILPLRVMGAGSKMLRPARLEELDSLDAGWQTAYSTAPATPTRYAALGFDLFANYPQQHVSPDALTITYARSPVALIADTDAPEYPEDLHPAFCDYGIYRLRFREGGQEFQKALPYFGRFMDEAKRYGAYIRARNLAGRYDKLPFELERYDLSKLLKLRADLMPARNYEK